MKVYKILIFSAISALSISGCTATKVISSPEVLSIDVVETQQATSSWSMNKGLALNTNVGEDCNDCYTTVPTRKQDKLEHLGQVSTYTDTNEESTKEQYAMNHTYPSEPTIESFSNKTVIQVGAFRKYAGAKVYAKKYDLLSNRYSVGIKKNVEEAIPLYRVRIEGFANKSEAKEFISKYGITEAFLVRN